VRRQAVFLSVVALAAVLRIYAISLYPLAGDEYGSIVEAKSLALNWNSIIYSGFMHFWIRLGESEMWLRLPSAILGIATVGVLFKIGEKLGGWTTGVVAGLLAATSPFNIHHSQEVRFYSLFMFASAVFILASVHYLDRRRTPGTRAALAMTGIVLVLSHFLGVLALYVQIAATAFAARSSWSKRRLALVLLGLPICISGLLLTPGVRQELWRLYHVYGNAPSSLEPVMTSVSIVNLAKAAFAGFVMVFGYHVYPLRLLLVIPGLCLASVLLLAGARRLWKETRWKLLPVAYLLALLGVYVVLDSVGGRVAAGVSPRHVAFIWPVLLVMMALGAASFRKPFLYLLVAATLIINASSIWAAWQKDWTYGPTTDYRSAASYASQWIENDTAVIHDGRSQPAIDFYFPKGTSLINSWPYLQQTDLTTQLNHQRLILVTDDWGPDRRRGFDRLMERLRERYSVVHGRVDYPLFEYVLDRKSSLGSPGYALTPDHKQVLHPPAFYGLEFQDLRLPVSVRVKDVTLNVLGASRLPDVEGRSQLSLPLAQATIARRVIFLSDVVGAGGLQPGEPIAEVSLESSNGRILKFPLHLNKETASWDTQCAPTAQCATVFQWHKRMAIVGQNSYEGALRDFPAGLHAVVFDLPGPVEVAKIAIRYKGRAGHLYVWGIALPNNDRLPSDQFISSQPD